LHPELISARNNNNNNLKIAFKTSNFLEINLRIKEQITDDGNKYPASGVHQLTCPDCGNSCVGQNCR
jgi:hypothetical protein